MQLLLGEQSGRVFLPPLSAVVHGGVGWVYMLIYTHHLNNPDKGERLE